MIIGIPTERTPGERRVAITPSEVAGLTAGGHTVSIENGAGERSGFASASYERHGARTVTRREIFDADVVLQVKVSSAPELRAGQTVIGFADPLSARAEVEKIAHAGVVLFALELLPRITRAQSMDALSSMATVAGYKAALIAAAHLPRMFPMMVTAAGTIAPAKVLVIGAGVAGLQAIATARRLGAVVTAYDVRPEAREEAESVGARFAELDLDTGGSGDERGYAREMGETFYRKQRELMTRLAKGLDVIISTAAVPGKRAPVLVTESMLDAMNPGGVVVDLAAASGGNCERTVPDEIVEHDGVTILGPTNVPATVPGDASRMYGKNITAFLGNLLREGKLHIDLDDEIIRETLVSRDGTIVHPRLGGQSTTKT